MAVIYISLYFLLFNSNIINAVTNSKGSNIKDNRTSTEGHDRRIQAGKLTVYLVESRPAGNPPTSRTLVTQKFPFKHNKPAFKRNTADYSDFRTSFVENVLLRNTAPLNKDIFRNHYKGYDLWADKDGRNPLTDPSGDATKAYFLPKKHSIINVRQSVINGLIVARNALGKHVGNIRIFGLGNWIGGERWDNSEHVTEITPSSYYQLDILQTIMTYFPNIKVTSQDPRTTKPEKAKLEEMGISVLKADNMNTKDGFDGYITIIVVFAGTYNMYANILAAHWSPEEWKRIIVVGSDFQSLWSLQPFYIKSPLQIYYSNVSKTLIDDPDGLLEPKQGGYKTTIYYADKIAGLGSTLPKHNDDFDDLASK